MGIVKSPTFQMNLKVPDSANIPGGTQTRAAR